MRFLSLFFVLLCSLGQPLDAQTMQYVTAKSGLNMRNAPSVKSKSILRVPVGASVEVEEKKYKSETLSGLAGNWRKAKYKGKTGYMFDAYLSAVKPGTSGISEPGTENPFGDLFYVDVASGLNMRSEPTIRAQSLLRVPNGEAVQLEAKNYKTETISGRKGNWRKGTYQGKTGYLFDAYLSSSKPVAGATKPGAAGQIQKPSAKGSEEKLRSDLLSAKANLIYSDESLSSFELFSTKGIDLYNSIIGEGSAEKPSEAVLLQLSASKQGQGKVFKVLVEDITLNTTIFTSSYILGENTQSVGVGNVGCGRLRIRIKDQDGKLLFQDFINFYCGE